MLAAVRARFGELALPLRSSAYRRLWLARLMSEFGDWAARLALGLLILERTKSPALTGAIVGVTFLPWVGLGQFLATFGDRFDRRNVMIGADLARAVTYVAIALIDGPVWSYFVLAFIASAFDAPFKSSRSAVLVNITSRIDYPNALRLETVTVQTGTLAGLMAGGGLSAMIGPEGALAANALTFVASALALAGLPKIRPASEARPSVGAGLRVLRGDPYVRRALAIAMLVTIPATTIETQLPVYATQVAGFGELAIGGLAVAIPVGTILATLIVRANAGDASLLRRGAVLAIVAGAVISPAFALGRTAGAMWVAFLFTGVAFGCTVPTNVVAGRRIPDEVRASVYGFFEGVILVGFGIGSVLGGALAERAGVTNALVVCGALVAIAGVWALVVAPRSPAELSASTAVAPGS